MSDTATALIISAAPTLTAVAALVNSQQQARGPAKPAAKRKVP